MILLTAFVNGRERAVERQEERQHALRASVLFAQRGDLLDLIHRLAVLIQRGWIDRSID